MTQNLSARVLQLSPTRDPGQSLGPSSEEPPIDLLRKPRRRAMPLSDEGPNDAIDLRHIAEKRTGPGIMVFTSSRKLVYQDSEAWELCKEINLLDAPEHMEILPRRVVTVCNEVKKQMRRRTHAKDWEQFRVKNVLSNCPRPILISGVGLPNHENPQQAQILVTIEVLGRRKLGILEQTKQRFHLTVREVTVVQQLLKGWTNRQIGNSLGVREQTVKEHIKHIMEKTKTTTRTGILVQMLRL
jgi:DNA-binding CsgD family transcriptional regulator